MSQPRSAAWCCGGGLGMPAKTLCAWFWCLVPAVALSDYPLFAFYGEPRGAACPAPLSDPPGHPTTRPFGFAALLDLSGSHKTRGLCPLRHPVALFPDKSALLARVNGEWVRAVVVSGYLTQQKKAQHSVLRLSRLSRQQTHLPISASTSAIPAFSVAIFGQRSVAWPTLRPALKALP